MQSTECNPANEIQLNKKQNRIDARKLQLTNGQPAIMADHESVDSLVTMRFFFVE